MSRRPGAGNGKGRGIVAPPPSKAGKGRKRPAVDTGPGKDRAGAERWIAAGKPTGAPKGRRTAGTVAPVVDLARERRIAGKVAELRDLLDTGAVDAARTRAMLAGELEARPVTDDPDVSTSIRLPGSLLTRADALAAVLPGPPGSKLTRSGVIRAALERGLSGLEADAARATLTSSPPDLSGVLAELDALRARVEAVAADQAMSAARFAALSPADLAGDAGMVAALMAVPLDVLDARATLPPADRARTLVALAEPLRWTCPTCAAAPGAPCVSVGRALMVGSPFMPSHPERIAP